jgi:hyperosmotically inducible protein
MSRKLRAGMILGAALMAAPFGLASDRALEPGSGPRIEQQVGRELGILLPYNHFDFLSFRVNGDTVVLLGKVTRPTLKRTAEQAVRRIEGVNAVSNQIEVLPVSPDDERLRSSLYKAIYRHTALQALATQPVPPIRILVENRNVTLEGSVGSYMDKTVAGAQARTVPGVFSVVNNLLVDNTK